MPKNVHTTYRGIFAQNIYILDEVYYFWIAHELRMVRCKDNI